jgi:hypothetical protein
MNTTDGRSSPMRERWDDPAFWQSITVGHCIDPRHTVREGHVLRFGLCWEHRPERQEAQR